MAEVTGHGISSAQKKNKAKRGRRHTKEEKDGNDKGF